MDIPFSLVRKSTSQSDDVDDISQFSVLIVCFVDRIDRKKDKADRKILDSQERAFWDVHRPVVSYDQRERNGGVRCCNSERMAMNKEERKEAP